MLHASFNKPAVKAFFQGLGAQITGIEVRLEGGNIAFRGIRDTVANNPHFLPLEARHRGGATINFLGRKTSEVEAALFNPDENPFFLLEQKNGWVIPKPFIDKLRSPGDKSDPPRTMPHLRVWSGETHRGRPTNFNHRGVITSGILNSIQTLQVYHASEHAASEPTPDEVAVAEETLTVFELLARSVLPRRGGKSIWHDRKLVLAIDLDKVTAMLPDLKSPDREHFVNTLPPQTASRRLYSEDDDVPEGEDEFFAA